MENRILPVTIQSYCIIQKDPNYLFLHKRKWNSPTNRAGLWEFAGIELRPAQELNSGHPLEIKKATGIQVEITQPLFHTERRIIQEFDLDYIAVFSLAKAVGGEFRNYGSHEHPCWVDKKDILDFPLTPEAEKAFLELNKSTQ